jgi:hypothetical protein
MKKGSANTAFSVVGVDSGRNKYLLDGLNHRLDLKGRWETLRDMRRKWLNSPGVQNVYVGYETFGAQSDMDYFLEQMEVTNNSFPITELAWPRDGEGSKDDRVQRLGPDLRSKKFYLPALQIRNGKPHWWNIADDGKTVEYREFTNHSSTQRRMTDEGTPYRIASYIGRADSDGNIYDVTKQLFDQVLFYPFSGLKDLIDATSRIYDMDPRPPIVIDERDLEPEAFDD